MTDLISRADAIEAVRKCKVQDIRFGNVTSNMMLVEKAKVITELMLLPSADAEPTMTEEVREALMRLTMCAREECGMCKYKDECGFDFQYNISTENMHTILDALSADAVSREKYDKLIQELNDSPKGKWIPLDGKLPKIIGEHVLVTIKWADDDLEVCEMCPTVADRYNIIAFQQMPLPYDGEPLKSELQCSGARMKGGAE